jgi:hypothetical protein
LDGQQCIKKFSQPTIWWQGKCSIIKLGPWIKRTCDISLPIALSLERFYALFGHGVIWRVLHQHADRIKTLPLGYLQTQEGPTWQTKRKQSDHTLLLVECMEGRANLANQREAIGIILYCWWNVWKEQNKCIIEFVQHNKF